MANSANPDDANEIPWDLALKLLRKLAEDDAFRDAYRKDSVAALRTLGFPSTIVDDVRAGAVTLGTKADFQGGADSGLRSHGTCLLLPDSSAHEARGRRLEDVQGPFRRLLTRFASVSIAPVPGHAFSNASSDASAAVALPRARSSSAARSSARFDSATLSGVSI